MLISEPHFSPKTPAKVGSHCVYPQCVVSYSPVSWLRHITVPTLMTTTSERCLKPQHAGVHMLVTILYMLFPHLAQHES